MRVQEDDVAVVTNVGEHLIELFLGWRLLVQAPMRHDGSDPERVIDQRAPKADAPVEHINHRDIAFRPFERVAQSAGGVEIDRDDLETARGGRRAQRIARGCLSDTTF